MGEAFGLYSHIRNNRWRSMVLLASLFGMVAMLTYGLTLIFITQRYSAPLSSLMSYAATRSITFLPFAFLGAGVWVVVGFAMNTAMVSWATGSQEATRESHPRFYRLTELLCMTRGMTVPRLEVLETEALNAFASGVTEKQYTVTVTTGLMEALDDRELSAVIAHELTHIRNHDVRLMIIAVLITGVIGFFGEMLLRGRGFRFGNSNEKGSAGIFGLIIGVVIVLLAWLFSVLLQFSLSRRREFLADAGAVELTKDPDAMISALLKISGHADIENVPSGIMDMCIENDKNGFIDMFSTHPPMSARIEALQAYAGGIISEVPRTASVPEIGAEDAAASLPQTQSNPLPFPLPLPLPHQAAGLVEKRGPWARLGLRRKDTP